MSVCDIKKLTPTPMAKSEERKGIERSRKEDDRSFYCLNVARDFLVVL